MRFRFAVICSILWLSIGSSWADHRTDHHFDYYVLSLSWSPEYCVSHREDKKQCGNDRHYSFVLHGLWPQYTQGWPQFCSKQSIPDDIRHEFINLYPSEKLLDHEWTKHGTCSGLTPHNYLMLSQDVFQKVSIPHEYAALKQTLSIKSNMLKTELIAANPWLTPQAVALVCKKRYLQELRVCLNSTGDQAVPCGQDVIAQEQKTCRENIVIRAVH